MNQSENSQFLGTEKNRKTDAEVFHSLCTLSFSKRTL